MKSSSQGIDEFSNDLQNLGDIFDEVENVITPPCSSSKLKEELSDDFTKPKRKSLRRLHQILDVMERVVYTIDIIRLKKFPSRILMCGYFDHTLRLYDKYAKIGNSPILELSQHVSDLLVVLDLGNMKIATSSRDSNVIIYDLSKFFRRYLNRKFTRKEEIEKMQNEIIEQSFIFTHHTDYVWCMLKIPDRIGKNLICSGGSCQFMYIWNYVNGDIKYKLNGHSDSIYSAIVFDTNTIVTGSNDSTLRTWTLPDFSEKIDDDDVKKCKILYEDKLIKVGATIWSLCKFDDDKILCGTESGKLFMFNIKSKQKIFEFSVHDDGNDVNSIMMLSKELVVTAGDDDNVRIFNVNSLIRGEVDIMYEMRHGMQVNQLVLMPNKDMMSCSSDGSVAIWDSKSILQKRRFIDAVFDKQIRRNFIDLTILLEQE